MFWCAKSKNHIGFAQSGQLSELSYIFVFLTFLFTYTGIFTSYDAKFFNRQRPPAPFRASPHLQGRLQTIGRHRGWRSGKRRGTVKKYVRGRLCPLQWAKVQPNRFNFRFFSSKNRISNWPPYTQPPRREVRYVWATTLYFGPHVKWVTRISHSEIFDTLQPLWLQSTSTSVAMVWREPTNHVTDCYFCAIDVTGINRKNRSSLKYPDLESARHPVAHCDDIPVPVFGELPDISDEDSSSVSEDEEQDVVLDDDAPHPFSQKELNDLVRGLSLSQSFVELLASRLKEKNLLSDSARITFYRNRHQEFLRFFLWREGLGVLYRYCSASAQAWSATVWTQRLETVHWQQQAITEMCSASQRQPVCLCTPCSLDYTEGEVWSGEVRTW